MEQDSFERWEGKVSAKLRNTTKEQAWPIVKDFFNLHKRFASLASCYGIHGSNGEPGCIRYCAGFSIPSNGSGNVSWSKERLVAVDDVDLSLKYEIVESNIGFKSYESTMRVISDDDDDGDDGCLIEWSFTVDPVETLVFEDLVSKYRVGLQLMAQKMEDEIAEEEEGMQRWEGKASAELKGTTADQIWPQLEDFCNIHKWFPIDTSYQVEGVTGLVRYCVATIKDDADPEKVSSTMWAKEKLLIMDPIQRSVTYEVIESNMGFKSYVATMKVLPISDDDKPAVCKIEWSFVCDPVEGWTYQGFLSCIESSLQFMAKKMEQAFSA